MTKEARAADRKRREEERQRIKEEAALIAEVAAHYALLGPDGQPRPGYEGYFDAGWSYPPSSKHALRTFIETGRIGRYRHWFDDSGVVSRDMRSPQENASILRVARTSVCGTVRESRSIETEPVTEVDTDYFPPCGTCLGILRKRAIAWRAGLTDDIARKETAAEKRRRLAREEKEAAAAKGLIEVGYGRDIYIPEPAGSELREILAQLFAPGGLVEQKKAAWKAAEQCFEETDWKGVSRIEREQREREMYREAHRLGREVKAPLYAWQARAKEEHHIDIDSPRTFLHDLLVNLSVGTALGGDKDWYRILDIKPATGDKARWGQWRTVWGPDPKKENRDNEDI